MVTYICNPKLLSGIDYISNTSILPVVATKLIEGSDFIAVTSTNIVLTSNFLAGIDYAFITPVLSPATYGADNKVTALPGILQSTLLPGNNQVSLAESSTIKLDSTLVASNNVVSYIPHGIRPTTNQMWPRSN